MNNALETVAVLGSDGGVIAWAEVPRGARAIEVAGAVAADGSPVNRREHRVSRNKANLAKVADSWNVPPLVKRESNGLVFYVR